jgi:hypothetical protein
MISTALPGLRSNANLDCPNAHKGQLRRAMAEEGLREMPFDFDLEGAKVLVDF